MGVRMIKHFIQAELRIDTAHTVTWLDAAMKPRPGMVLLFKDDPRPWTVVHHDYSSVDSDRLERIYPVSQACGRKLEAAMLMCRASLKCKRRLFTLKER